MITNSQLQRTVALVIQSNGTLTCGQALDQIMAEDARHPITVVYGATQVTLNAINQGEAVVITPVGRQGSSEVHAMINGHVRCGRARGSQCHPVNAHVTCSTCVVDIAEARGEL